jgi:hypothetical protein
VLDLDGRSRDESEPLASSLEDALIYTQDVKCFHCGFVSGQLVGRPSLPRDVRTFVAVPGSEPPADFDVVRPRCLRCGGPCFLDEVETRVRLRQEDLEKPRRGRKPKPRPDAQAL